MDILYQMVLVAFLVGRSQISATSQHPCVDDCVGVRNGKYHSCEGCQYHVSCNYGMMTTSQCPPNQEWDDRRKGCRTGESKTCASDEENDLSTEITTETVNGEIQDGDSLVVSTLNNVNVHGLDNPDDTTSILIETYIIPIAIAAAVFMVATYILCVLWKYNWCRKGKDISTRHVSLTSVATQTGISADYPEYDELHYIPHRPSLPPVPPPSVHYMAMPYAVSNFHKYQELTVPYSHPEEQTGQENGYLELLGYPYLQIQDDKKREKVHDMVTPIVAALCNDDMKDTARYVSLEKKLKTLAEEIKDKA